MIANSFLDHNSAKMEEGNPCCIFCLSEAVSQMCVFRKAHLLIGLTAWLSITPGSPQNSFLFPQTKLFWSRLCTLNCLNCAVFLKKQFSRMFHFLTSKSSTSNCFRQYSGPRECTQRRKKRFLERADCSGQNGILFWSASVPQTTWF